MVARCVRDAKVVGSNPVASTKTATPELEWLFWFRKTGKNERTHYHGFARASENVKKRVIIGFVASDALPCKGRNPSAF